MRFCRPALIAAVAALSIAACGSQEPDDTTAGPSSSATTTIATTSEATPSETPEATTTSTPTPTKPALPPGVDQVISITINKGKANGQTGRVKVKLGSTVRLTVTSDVTDEIHLHGYDKSIDVKAGRPASLTFKADIPGVFEAELEDRGLRLTQLQVQ